MRLAGAEAVHSSDAMSSRLVGHGERALMHACGIEGERMGGSGVSEGAWAHPNRSGSADREVGTCGSGGGV